MQGDLISRSALIEAFRKKASEIETLGIIPGYTIALNVIKEQPTAYDVEKVVEQLKELKEFEYDDSDEEPHYTDVEDWFDAGASEGSFKAYKKAIEIVRNGGKE